MKRTILLVGLICLLSVPAEAKYGGGTGEPNDPYRIATAEELNDIGNHVEDFNKCFVLVNDINLADYTGTAFNIIGNDSNVFTGVFDGNEHAISKFTYKSTTTPHIGLFGYVDDPEAEIKDLTLTEPNVDGGTAGCVGSVVGRMKAGTISGCCVEGGSVSGGYAAGGLAGLIFGEISNCHVTCTVSGDWEIGGLVGSNGGTISNCHATGNVEGTYELIGGLAGVNAWVISNCYATGSVRGEYRVGGLVGGNYSATISNSYATGSVSGDGNTGGLVGHYTEETISNCYAAGKVTGDGDTGALVGYYSSGSYAKNFWDTDTNPDVNGIGNTADPNVIGESTANMQKASTYIDAGWDFVNMWDICDGMNYPKLAWQIPVLGDFVCPDGVEINDLAVLIEQWLQAAGFPSADVVPVPDGDGIVNFLDYCVLADNWLQGTE